MDDLIVTGGTVIGPDGRMATDVVIRGSRIIAVGDAARLQGRRIDATGHLVMPGGVDSHCHIEQVSGAGLMNADTFETATRSALRWGTTTGLETGDLAAVTSDHAPYRLDASGKFAHGVEAPFPKLANGQPELEMRLPLMFAAMVTGGRLGAERFVALTATTPADIFGLTGKGRIALGMDGDIVLWNPARQVTLGDTLDGTGYNPWAGRRVTGWPEIVIRRGAVVVQGGHVLAQPGSGRRVVMAQTPVMAPRPALHPLV